MRMDLKRDLRATKHKLTPPAKSNIKIGIV